MGHGAFGNFDYKVPVNSYILGKGTAILKHRPKDEASNVITEGDVGDILANLYHMA